MRCLECGGNYENIHGDLPLTGIGIGKFILGDVDFSRCSACGDIMIPAETCEKADKLEKHLLNEALNKLPVKDWLSGADAAAIMGITRQAFHKNKKIRKGFIYSINHYGKRLYHKKSVEFFQANGDGRFDIKRKVVSEIRHICEKEQPFYIKKIQTSKFLPFNQLDNGIFLPEIRIFKNSANNIYFSQGGIKNDVYKKQ